MILIATENKIPLTVAMKTWRTYTKSPNKRNIRSLWIKFD